MYFYIGTSEAKKHPDLSPIHSAMFQLAKTLLYTVYQFTLFCNNLFGNSRLFSLLRQFGIGACGTARKNVTEPIFRSLDAWIIAWGTLHLKVEDRTRKIEEYLSRYGKNLIKLGSFYSAQCIRMECSAPQAASRLINLFCNS